MPTKPFNKKFYSGCQTLVFNCADLKPGEKVLIVCNQETLPIAQTLRDLAASVAKSVDVAVVPEAAMHGEEPPSAVASQMPRADVIFGLTRQSMAHTKARQKATARGARYLSLPDYSVKVLERPAMKTDFRKFTFLTEEFADRFTQASELLLTTNLGTNLWMDIKGRRGNAAPGWCFQKGTLASPPDIEANIAVVENKTHGVVVVDGSIPCKEIGLLDSPQTLTVEKGRVVHIKGTKAKILNRLFDRLKNPKTRVIAEFGLGFNPLAKLCGSMLEDEGASGTVHLGIGSNATIGGKNNVAFHLDFVIRRATYFIDGKEWKAF